MLGLNLIDALRKIAAILLVIFFIDACQSMKQEQSGAEAFEKIPPGESAQIARITVQTTEL